MLRPADLEQGLGKAPRLLQAHRCRHTGLPSLVGSIRLLHAVSGYVAAFPADDQWYPMQ